MSERELCKVCGGNGVVKIPGGISTCDRCKGDCWDPSPARSLRSGLEELITEWRNLATRLDSVHATMGLGWWECAKQAESLLLRLESRAGEQEAR